MAGLDTIKHYSGEDGSAVQADTTTAAPLTAKAQAAKGPYALPTPTGAVGVDPSLLENMQQLINEREIKKNSFMEAMKDANAWWSGGIAGPGEALRARETERQAQEATTFGMKSQLAQYKTAQEAAKAAMASLRNETGSGAVSPVTGTKMPPAVANEINRLLDLGDVEGAKAARKKWIDNETLNASKSTYEASSNKQEPTFISGIGNLNISTNEKRVYDETGMLPSSVGKEMQEKGMQLWRQNRPAAATTATAAPSANTLPHAKPLDKVVAPAVTKLTAPTITPTAAGGNAQAIAADLGVPIISGARSNEKQQAIWDESVAAGRPGFTASGNPIAKPGTSKHETDNAIDVNPAEFTQEHANKLIKAGFKQPFANDKNHWELAVADQANLPKQKAAVKLAATEPTAAVTKTAAPATAGLPFPNPINAEQQKANDDFLKKRADIPLESAGKESVTAAEEAGKDLGQLRKETERATNTIAAAQRVIDLANDPKLNKVMGYMHGNDPKATVLGTVPRMAANLVGQGENFEEAVKQNVFSKEELAAHQRLQTDATQLGIEYTANMFKGARLGIGLEKLGLKGKGVSADYLPEVNKLYATLAKDAAEFEIKKNKAFAEWKGNDPMRTYGQFLDSPQYDKMRNEERELLLSRYPGVVKPESEIKSEGHKTTKSGNKYKIVQ